MNNFFIQKIFILLLWFANLSGQTDFIRFENYTINQGLSQNTIYDIIQDSEGYLWIASQDGLNRFDGLNFSVFKSNGEQNSLSDNWTICLLDDKEGNIWIGTFGGGLNKYDKKSKKFTSFLHRKEDSSSLPSNEVWHIFKDSQGNIWTSHINGGISKYNKSTNNFTRYFSNKTISELSQSSFSSISEDKSGILWLTSLYDGLFSFNPRTQEYKHFKLDANDKNSIQSNDLWYSVIDKDDNIWIASENAGLIMFDQEFKVFKNFLFDKNNGSKLNSIRKMILDDQDQMWLATNGGAVIRFSIRDYSYELVGNTKSRNTFPDQRIWTIMKDKSDILWMGTFTSGIIKYDTKHLQFNHIYSIPNDDTGLPNNYVKALAENYDGRIWIGTDKGISLFDEKSRKFTNFNNITKDKDEASGDLIRALAVDNDILWIGTWGKGLYKFSIKNNRVISFNKFDHPELLNDNFIRALLVDSKNNLWIGTSFGLSRLNLVSGGSQIYFNDSNNPKSISENRIRKIYEDSKNRIWIATEAGGLNLFNENANNFDQFVNILGDSNSINNNKVRGISEISENIYLVATYGGGISLFNLNEKKFQSLTVDNGLPNNSTYEILKDKNGYLWISSNKGLSKFDPQKIIFTNFDKSDGLQDDEFNSGAALAASSGNFYFGGINGFNYFNPLNIEINEGVPNVVINEIKVFDMVKDLCSGNELRIPYDSNFISISFSALEFTAPERIRFEYTISNLIESWVDNGSKRTINLANLDPGEYVLKIKAINHHNIESDKFASLKIVIVPPFYKTWFFSTALFMLILGLVASFFYLRFSIIKKQNVKLENVVKERTNELLNNKRELEYINENQKKLLEELSESREQLLEINISKDKFFSIIAHDIKSPFTSVLGYAELLKNEVNQIPREEIASFAESIYASSKNLYNFLDNLLTWARIHSGRMNHRPAKIILNELVFKIIEIYKPGSILKKIIIYNKINSDTVVFADEHMLHSIFQNLISNAIKFTHLGGYIKIGSEVKNNFCEVFVSDNGVGIAKDDLLRLFKIDEKISTVGTNNEEGTGLGLNLTKELVEKNNGKIRVEGVEGKGTTFYFTIPIPN